MILSKRHAMAGTALEGLMKPHALKENPLYVRAHASRRATGGSEGQYFITYDCNGERTASVKVAWTAGTSLLADNGVNDLGEHQLGGDGDAVVGQSDVKQGTEKDIFISVPTSQPARESHTDYIEQRHRRRRGW